MNNNTHKISDTLRPIDQAKGLPSYLYVDDSQTAAERERVFFNNWSAVTNGKNVPEAGSCLLYTSPSPRDLSTSRMPSSA